MGTRKKAIERRRQDRKDLGLGLGAWFERLRTERRLKAAFKPKQRPARVRIPDEE